ncbi:uncharacterized protein LOC124180644 [Neodiprion fabricii]|uniref:uncharacterized protein LOC124180644 n=1 Tax=Neodiprion fabricii TaxID=2872261 RepID=UPI001ED8FB4E|nr:uncharacterized protein LOC124180644 [Neodiprion fabricii]
MIPKIALELIDRTLKDIMEDASPFGGKTIILGGDFRLVLPIVKRGGNGEVELFVPEKEIQSNNLVDDLYPRNLPPDELTNRAILAPLNVEVNQLNTEILRRMDGNIFESKSIDYATLQGIDTADAALDEEATLRYPIEYLNGLTPSGLPPHNIQLKVGAIVMSLRNLSISDRLCNGTRSRLTRSRRRESSGEEPLVMENPRVPETIPSPSVDPLPIPSTIPQIDLLKIMSQQQEAAERQQQQLLQLLLDQQEQREREQEQQLEQRRREREQQLEQRRLDREAQERSETSLHELFRTTVAALQAVHQVNGSGEPAVTPLGSGVVWPLLSPVPSPVPVFAVRQVRHPGRIQDVRDSRSVPFTRKVVESPISRRRVNNETTRSHTAQSKEQSCACCKGNHYIAFCSTFRDKSLDQRREVVSAKKLCFNCLGPHQQKDCRSNKTCRVCNGRHHSLLHRNSSSISTAANSGTSQGQAAVAQPAVQNAPISNSASQVSNHSAQPTMIKRSPVLLATVQLIASNPETGERIIARALLDQGSESSFVTESLAQQLRLRRHQATIPIIGVGAHQSAVTRGTATLQLQSRAHTSFSCQVEALVLPRLTSYLPSFRLLVEDWPHLRGLNLADPSFAHPGQIDVILGADIYSNIIGQGVRRGAPGTPIAQETQFGWVLSGCVSAEAASPSYGAVQGFQCSLDHELLDLVQQFWKQEEVSKPLALTSEEERCEQHFRETVSRTAPGRYVVRLPLKDNSVELGNSRNPAHQMLLCLEKRFGSDAKLKEAYSSFLREYRELGHMRRAMNTPEDNSRVFYLPHHGVVRDSSSTTKLRVVFNGSQRTNLGLSLNDNLLVGPKVQTDLADILLRWRQYPVAFSSDIVKMYRQILVHNDDQDFQRILWREEPELPIEEYQLTTVTYGLASAPYLAIRVLHQLVQDEGKQYPFASHVILENTYVDDILSRAEDVDQGREKINELNQLLKAGGFELQKWTSSHPETLVDISRNHQEIAMHLNLDQSPFFRAPGLAWRPDIDAFAFSPQIHQLRDNFTKRKVLSQTAQLFDPLGWLSPITIRAKIFMQELWALGFDWDEPLSASLSSRWIEFLQDFQGISAITIPRWIGLSSASLGIEIHGFADASQSALGAVIYARTYINTHEVRVSLVCAKTKVAPLKKVTIPRLELCAANLLVRLMCHVENTLNFENTPVYLWTDSTVALAWIKSHPSRWKKFVRNRVTEIQEFARARWYHISGFENPADLASRGASPEQLQKSELWTFGPSWLSKPSVNWPSLSPRPEENIHLEQRKGLSTPIATAKPLQIWDLVDRYSKLSTLLKVTSLCKRAANRFLAKTTSNRVNTSITVGPISTLEWSDAQLFWTKVTQQAYFAEKIRQIETSSSLTRSHPLSRLTPFIDLNGFLRVGGRLNHSLLSYDEKHPFILPRESSFSTLIIDHHHRLTLHGGPQLTLATIRQRYWILGGRVPIRMSIHRCVPCARHRATLSSQQMGQLPQSRVTQSRPFLHSGVDYAGPFSIRASRGRGAKSCKGYIVIFICFTTSAVHLELVSDYTTEAFIAAYKRFTSRRGICASIASDCGTNLVGADSKLRRLLAASSKEFAEIANTLASHGTQWRFHPPSAPHFGGKWEAGVKSVKFHLKRVIGEATQTFEQFATFLT